MTNALEASHEETPAERFSGVRGRVTRAALVLLAWAFLVIALIAAGHLISHSSSISALDRQITSTVVAHRSPALNAAMKAITWLGSWAAVALAAVVLAVLTACRLVPPTALILAAVAWAGEQSGVTLVKNAVHRARPPRDIWLVNAHGWSWPSGHASAATLVFGVLTLTVFHLTTNLAVRVAACIVAACAVLAVGFSRIELGVHWTTDVTAGIVFVSLWLLVSSALLRSRVLSHAQNARAPEVTLGPTESDTAGS